MRHKRQVVSAELKKVATNGACWREARYSPLFSTRLARMVGSGSQNYSVQGREKAFEP